MKNLIKVKIYKRDNKIMYFFQDKCSTTHPYRYGLQVSSTYLQKQNVLIKKQISKFKVKVINFFGIK